MPTTSEQQQQHSTSDASSSDSVVVLSDLGALVCVSAKYWTGRVANSADELRKDSEANRICWRKNGTPSVCPANS